MKLISNLIVLIVSVLKVLWMKLPFVKKKKVSPIVVYYLDRPARRAFARLINNIDGTSISCADVNETMSETEIIYWLRCAKKQGVKIPKQIKGLEVLSESCQA